MKKSGPSEKLVAGSSARGNDVRGTWTNVVNVASGLALLGAGLALGGPQLERLDTVAVGTLIGLVCSYNLYRIYRGDPEHPDIVRGVGVLSLWLVGYSLSVDSTPLELLTDTTLALGMLIFAVNVIEFARQFRNHPRKQRQARSQGPTVLDERPVRPSEWSNLLSGIGGIGLAVTAMSVGGPAIDRTSTAVGAALIVLLSGYNLYRRRRTGYERPAINGLVALLNVGVIAVLLAAPITSGLSRPTGLFLGLLGLSVNGEAVLRRTEDWSPGRTAPRRDGPTLRSMGTEAVGRLKRAVAASTDVAVYRKTPAEGLSTTKLWVSMGALRDLFGGSTPRRYYLPLVLAVPVGIGAGIGAAAFRYLMYLVHTLLFETVLPQLPSDLFIVALPVAGAAVAGILIYEFAPEAAGHGVPENMEAVAVSGGRIRHRLAPFKVLVSALVLGSGGSGGREGPIARIGAGVGSSLGQLFDLCEENIRLLLAAGIAAGIGATFGAPLGGIFFAVEIVMVYRLKLFNLLVLAVATGVAVGTAEVIAPHFVWFSFLPFPLPELSVAPSDVLYALPYGLILGLLAWVWVTVLERTEHVFQGLEIPDDIKPALGAIPVGIFGIWFAKYGVMGVGYAGLRLAVTDAKMGALLLIGLAVSKLIATQFTIGSGGSGGVFAPTLYIGGMFAVGFHQFAGVLPVSAALLGVVGMGAIFSGAAFAPLTGMFLVAEVFDSYELVALLAVPCLVSYGIMRTLRSSSIYTSRLHQRGILAGYSEKAAQIGPGPDSGTQGDEGAQILVGRRAKKSDD